jgi:sugar/nucleoside kinase (ribokinase family)
MSAPKFDVLGIGNAIVDIIASTEEDFLVRENLVKSSMRLIDAAEAERLYDHMGPAVETSGGSAGNTIAGVASFGGKGAFAGKVAADDLGRIYRHDMHALGIHFETQPLKGPPPTARSMIFITPDGERTMNTYLGACIELGPEDIDSDVVAASAVTYYEGYLWDPPRAKEALLKASKIAHANGRKISLTLSDQFCVDRHRSEFRGLLVDGTVDILFANDSELRSLYETADLDTAISALRADCRLAAVTLGPDGACVVTPEGVEKVPVNPVERVVDTTGAGDLFAAGFLYGYTHGFAHKISAELGNLAAGEVISHIGPRPAAMLKQLAQQAGIQV